MPKQRKSAKGRNSKTQPKSRTKSNGTAGKQTGGFPKPRILTKQALPRAPRKEHHAMVCSLLDPFCVHARGAQRPDGGPPSIPYQVRSIVPIVTVGTGTTIGAYTVVVPNPFECYGNWGRTTGNYTTPAGWSPTPGVSGSILADTSLDKIRIVSWGVLIRSIASASSCQGALILRTDPEPQLADQAPGVMYGNETQVITLAPNTEFAWVSKPKSENAHLFKPTSFYTTTSIDFDWDSLAIEITSPSATSLPLVSLEIVFNVEFTFKAGSSSIQLSKQPAPASRHVLDAQAKAHSNMSSFVSGAVDVVSNKLAATATSALDSIVADIGMLFV